MNTSITPLLQGTWILESMGYRDSLGVLTEMFGQDPRGIVTFDPYGFVNAQMSVNNRPPFENEVLGWGSASECTSAFNSYMAFFGTYAEVIPGTLIIHLDGCLFPNWQGKELIRFAAVIENKLFLTTPATRMGELEMVVEAIWRKA